MLSIDTVYDIIDDLLSIDTVYNIIELYDFSSIFTHNYIYYQATRDTNIISLFSNVML